MSGLEDAFVRKAFDTNWLSSVGENLDRFAQEFSAATGAPHALPVNSGTSALQLAMRLLGVQQGDEVLVSTFTFCASVNPILYEGGRPTFIDSEPRSWNMDPALLREVIEARAKTGTLPKAVILVHVYGQCADMQPILDTCNEFGIPVVEDNAESLGATYGDRWAGTFGRIGTFSFNGNKMITTTAGGMITSSDATLMERAHKLAAQAREPAPHYEHAEIGYNFRMSNVLAGIGRGQLAVLEERIAARRRAFNYYQEKLGRIPGITFMPEAPWGRHTRWLTCITLDPDLFGSTPEAIRLALEAGNIESRPLWKPMHQQPVYKDFASVGGAVADNLFETGLALPSGSNLTDSDLDRICTIVQACAKGSIPVHSH